VTSATSPRQSSATRLLAFTLLLLVTCGSSFQALHRHRNAFSSAQQIVVAVNNPDTSNAPDDGLLPDGKCLVCQFHRQLATSVTPAPLLVSAPSVQVIITESLASSYTSECETPRQGRGPPLNS